MSVYLDGTPAEAHLLVDGESALRVVPHEEGVEAGDYVDLDGGRIRQVLKDAPAWWCVRRSAREERILSRHQSPYEAAQRIVELSLAFPEFSPERGSPFRAFYEGPKLGHFYPPMSYMAKAGQLWGEVDGGGWKEVDLKDLSKKPEER